MRLNFTNICKLYRQDKHKNEYIFCITTYSKIMAKVIMLITTNKQTKSK